jgi:predicted nucleotidyltransferase
MILSWDFYEIRSSGIPLHGIKLRGRIRKFTIENEITCLIENASDEENVVRFALLANSDPKQVLDFIKNIVPEATVSESLKKIQNPVLSKLKVNDPTRYEI